MFQGMQLYKYAIYLILFKFKVKFIICLNFCKVVLRTFSEVNFQFRATLNYQRVKVTLNFVEKYVGMFIDTISVAHRC